MDLSAIRSFCLSLPGVTEDIKWDNDLVFSIRNKMFCATCMECDVQTLSFKAGDEKFEELTSLNNFRPAPYLARAKWVQMQDTSRERPEEIKSLLQDSYVLVRSRLSKKIQQELPPLN